MAKITITDILSENGLLNAINTRFDQIEDHLNQIVMYRYEIPGEDNAMYGVIDMNNNRIINLPEPIDPNEPARKQDVDGVVAGIFAHDLLTGLGDDDHPQYHNDARGDARYLRNTNAPFSNGAILFGDVNGDVDEHPSTFYRNPLNGYVAIGHANPTSNLHVEQNVAAPAGITVTTNAVVDGIDASIAFTDYTSAAIDNEINARRKSANSSSFEFWNKIAGVKTKSLEIANTGRAEFVDGILMPGQLTNTVATGTAPFVISSTTRVNNLNVAAAGTADTLLTTRTLWGQNFNGSANVSGNLSAVGNITGTGAVDLSATAGTLSLSATGANAVLLNTNGTERLRITSTGVISTGAESSPDVDAGGICINTGAADGFALTFKNSDVAHGMTAIAETDTYGAFGKRDALNGGMLFYGFGDADRAVEFDGFVTTENTAFTGPAAIVMRGATKNGVTIQAMSSTANIVTVLNNTTVAAAFKGNGNLEILGGIKLSNAGTVLSNYEEGTWTPVLADAVSAGNVGTVTIQDARYTRVGRTVTVMFYLTAMTTTGMTAGNSVVIRGLPFTMAGGNHAPLGTVRYANITFSGAGPVTLGAAGSSALLFSSSVSGGAVSSLIVSNLTSGTAQMIGQITYTI